MEKEVSSDQNVVKIDNITLYFRQADFNYNSCKTCYLYNEMICVDCKLPCTPQERFDKKNGVFSLEKPDNFTEIAEVKLQKQLELF